MGKLRRTPHLCRPVRAVRVLNWLHIEVCKLRPGRNFGSVIDEATRFVGVALLWYKNDTAHAHACRGHMLQRDETKNRKCVIRGTKTKVIHGCSWAICSWTGSVTCWAWHLKAIASGAADEGPVQRQWGRRSS
jgi:hypothetical protein